MSSSLDAAQQDIIDSFSYVAGNDELTLDYLIEIGNALPALPEEEKREECLVQGCQSMVWIASRLQDGLVYHRADSNTMITKGLVALLLKVFSGHGIDEVLRTILVFPERIGMRRFIGTQRSNGLLAMERKIKQDALKLKKDGNT